MMIFKKAILIIHGFAGSTKDEEPIFYELNRLYRFDVYNFVLPGHDHPTSKINYEDWFKSGEEHIERLLSYGYHEICVIGHSMGGVIASYLSIKYKQVTKVVLLAPAFEYLSDDNNKIKKLVNNGPKIIKSYTLKEIIGRTFKVTPKMVSEFCKMVADSRDMPSEITKPVLLIHGDADQIVPIESSKRIFELLGSKSKKFIMLSGVNHDVCYSDKTIIINNEIKKFLCNRPFSRDKISNC